MIFCSGVKFWDKLVLVFYRENLLQNYVNDFQCSYFEGNLKSLQMKPFLQLDQGFCQI